MAQHVLSAEVLAKAQAGFLQLVSLACAANDRLLATLSLADWLRKALTCFYRSENATLQNFAVEATDEVFVCLVAVFTCYLNHTRNILPKQRQICN